MRSVTPLYLWRSSYSVYIVMGTLNKRNLSVSCCRAALDHIRSLTGAEVHWCRDSGIRGQPYGQQRRRLESETNHNVGSPRRTEQGKDYMESELNILPTSTSSERQLDKGGMIHVLRRVPGAHAADTDADEVPRHLVSDWLQVYTSAVIQRTTETDLSGTPKCRLL